LGAPCAQTVMVLDVSAAGRRTSPGRGAMGRHGARHAGRRVAGQKRPVVEGLVQTLAREDRSRLQSRSLGGDPEDQGSNWGTLRSGHSPVPLSLGSLGI